MELAIALALIIELKLIIWALELNCASWEDKETPDCIFWDKRKAIWATEETDSANWTLWNEMRPSEANEADCSAAKELILCRLDIDWTLWDEIRATRELDCTAILRELDKELTLAIDPALRIEFTRAELEEAKFATWTLLETDWTLWEDTKAANEPDDMDSALFCEDWDSMLLCKAIEAEEADWTYAAMEIDDIDAMEATEICEVILSPAIRALELANCWLWEEREPMDATDKDWKLCKEL